MNFGTSMIWPLASEYARLGWAVRRTGWDGSSQQTDTGRALRWIVYHNSLFWLLYKNESGDRSSRVVTASDFGVDDFRAEDWTVLSPECLEMTGRSGNESSNQQGKLRYPAQSDAAPSIDPANPNAAQGACPVVPVYTSIHNRPKP